MHNIVVFELITFKEIAIVVINLEIMPFISLYFKVIISIFLPDLSFFVFSCC